MKLKNKIHISSALLMLVILLVLAFVIYFSFSQLTYSTEVEQLQAETNAWWLISMKLLQTQELCCGPICRSTDL